LSSPWSSQYLATRREGTGWSTEPLNPRLGSFSLYGQRSQEIPFKSFTEDLCSAWLVQDTDLTLAEEAPEGVPNLYRRENCAGAGYELLTTSYPPGFSRETEPQESEYVPQIQGFTEDGSCSFFRANATLTGDASTEDIFQLYQTCSGGQNRLVSVLPTGTAASVHSSLGTAAGVSGDFRNDSVWGAVSKDGSRVFWTASTAGGGGAGFQPGDLYLRANPTESQSASGECDEAGKACTLQIAGPGAAFWTANPEGSLVVYQVGDQLFEAEIKEQAGSLVSDPTLIAGGVSGLAGTGADATRIYLVSDEELAAGASAGEPNLYLYQRGTGFRLVTTLADSDSIVHSNEISIDNFEPGFRTSRISQDGLHVAFMSSRSLTGFDNTDVNSGVPNAEVYLYDATANGGAGDLSCISCNPSGVRPNGREIGFRDEGKTQVFAAARLSGWEYQLHPSRLLSDDGQRLFFESYDRLIPTDTNGVKDVYEWESSSSQAHCQELGAALYVPAAGGCISLISSGQSPQDSEFVDASADGRDAFFTTSASLAAEDHDLIDLYDARVGGGFAPRQPVQPCQGEACQSPGSAPADVTPASANYTGPGNLPRAPAKKCPKGKHKVKRSGKTTCVKNKNKKHKAKHKKGQRKTGGAKR
jgi:hypothetical protein